MTIPMETMLVYAADLFGTAVFAVTGAIRGREKSLDLLGVIVLACTVGVGGGILRDCAIGATPAAALTSGTYLALCIGMGLGVFKIPSVWVQKNAEIITYLDAVGLGVFTAIGTAKAMEYQLPPITVVWSGILTAVGGGMIRDVLVGTVPAVLKNDFYATASMIGGVLYLVLDYAGMPIFSRFVVVSLTVMVIRLWAYRHKLQLPRADQ